VASSLAQILGALKNVNVEILPYLEYFNKTAFSERDNFIRFISNFGKKKRFNNVSFAEYFRFPHSAFSAWWMSLIAEKHPLKSDAYHNLVKLLAILKLREECCVREVVLDTGDRKLSRLMKRNARGAGYTLMDFKKYKKSTKIILFLINFLKGLKLYFYSIYKLFIIRSCGGSGGKTLKNAQYAAITFFPLIDKNALNEKKFVNKYYGALQAALEKKYKDKFVWLAFTSNIDGYTFRKSVKLGKGMNSWNYRICFIEEWIGIKDLFASLLHYFFIMGKFIIRIPYLKKEITYSKEAVNTWELFAEDWFSSFAGGTLMRGIVYYRAFKNIYTDLKNNSSVMYFAENQSWEKALNFVFHGEKKVNVIGIVHTTVPLLLLALFDSEDEPENGGEYALSRLKPDYLACNGRIPMRLLLETDWNKKKAFLWYAVRFQYLKEHLKKSLPWPDRRNRVVIILSVKPNELKEMLYFVTRAFNGKVDYQIIVKEHYLFPIRPFIKRLNLNLRSDVFTVSKEDLRKILPEAKAMILTSSSAALEAVAVGCPVIIPRLSGTVDMNPLSGLSDLPIYVNTSSELREAVDNIMQRGDSPIPYEKCKNFVENYFEFFNSEEELMETLEKACAQR